MLAVIEKKYSYWIQKGGNPPYITKAELKEILGVSSSWLAQYIRKKLPELKKTGYKTRQHYLTREQLNIIFPEGIF